MRARCPIHRAGRALAFVLLLAAIHSFVDCPFSGRHILLALEEGPGAELKKAPEKGNDVPSRYTGDANGPEGDSPSTGWFPQSRLYATMLADPRKVGFAGGFRWHDDAFDSYRRRYNGMRSDVLGAGWFGAVSMGSLLPLYRWETGKTGDWQIGAEGSVWAVFAFKDRNRSYFSDASTMLNADYYLAFPLEFALGAFSARFRFYHVSTHIGDELLVLYPEIIRRNVSFEAVDLYLSYEFLSRIRLFAGGGYIAHSFQSARMRPGYVEYGLEIAPFGTVKAGRNLTVRLYLAGHGRNWQNNHWAYSGTYALGVTFMPAKSRPGRISLYGEFHHGTSPDGQFFHERTTYYGFGLLWELI